MLIIYVTIIMIPICLILNKVEERHNNNQNQ